MAEAVILNLGPASLSSALASRAKPPASKTGRVAFVATSTGRDNSGASLTTGAEVRTDKWPTGSRRRMRERRTGGRGCLHLERDDRSGWSATSRLAPKLPVGFAEVRYRIKSWRQFELCVEDARAAVREVGGGAHRSCSDFSMGGAVAIAVADEPSAERVVGLAPWIPDQLGLETLGGKPLDVLHGSLDRYLPGVPGVTPASSRRGFERARALGSTGTYTLIPGGLHGVAVRVPGGVLVPLAARRSAGSACNFAEQLDGFADESSAPNLHVRG